jgi:hypothetical protein
MAKADLRHCRAVPETITKQNDIGGFVRLDSAAPQTELRDASAAFDEPTSDLLK